MTITFSEQVTGFRSAADIRLENGGLVSMTTGDGGRTWARVFTPDEDPEDASNVVSLAAAYTDAAGNRGVATVSGNYAVDTRAPTVTISVSAASLRAGESPTPGPPVAACCWSGAAAAVATEHRPSGTEGCVCQRQPRARNAPFAGYPAR